MKSYFAKSEIFALCTPVDVSPHPVEGIDHIGVPVMPALVAGIHV